MKFHRIIAGVAVTIANVSCGHQAKTTANPGSGDATATEFRSAALAGKIAGADWAFAGGYATPDASDPSRLQLSFISENLAAPCDPFASNAKDGKYVGVTVAKGLGSTAFPTAYNQFVTFGKVQGDATGHTDIELGKGKIQIDAIDDKTVKGYLLAEADAQNLVNGAFELPYCTSRTPASPAPQVAPAPASAAKN